MSCNAQRIFLYLKLCGKSLSKIVYLVVVYFSVYCMWRVTKLFELILTGLGGFSKYFGTVGHEEIEKCITNFFEFVTENNLIELAVICLEILDK